MGTKKAKKERKNREKIDVKEEIEIKQEDDVEEQEHVKRKKLKNDKKAKEVVIHIKKEKDVEEEIDTREQKRAKKQKKQKKDKKDKKDKEVLEVIEIKEEEEEDVEEQRHVKKKDKKDKKHKKHKKDKQIREEVDIKEEEEEDDDEVIHVKEEIEKENERREWELRRELAHERALQRLKEFRAKYATKVNLPTNPLYGKIIDGLHEQTHEAWLMQCPKGMDLQRLVGQRIKLPGRRYRGDFKVRGIKYTPPLNEAIGFVNTKSRYELRKLKLHGLVVVSRTRDAIRRDLIKAGKYKPDAGSEFPEAPPPPKFKLPVRHPFFGRKYKKHIELPAAITNGLKKAMEKHEETTARLQRTANYYAIKRRMGLSYKALEDKEQEVRQSVLTGIRPEFMGGTAAPTEFQAVQIKQPQAIKAVVKLNGQTKVQENQKKSKSHKESLVNGTSHPLISGVTIKQEPESEPQANKREKRKHSEAERVPIAPITIKKEPEFEPQSKKRKKHKSHEESLLNGSSSLADSSVVIKQEPGSEPQRKKHTKNKVIDGNVVVKLEDSLVTIKQEPESPQKSKKHRKQEVNAVEKQHDSMVAIKEEPDSEAEMQSKKRRKHKDKNESLSVTIKEEPESESEMQSTKRRKHRDAVANEESLVGTQEKSEESRKHKKLKKKKGTAA